jgi:sugar phosphate permease
VNFAGEKMPDQSATLKRRWIIWSSLMLVYVISHFHRVAPAVIAEDLMRTFQTSGALLGGLASTYFYTYAMMQIPAGVLSDTLGGRMTIAVGSVVMGVGSILFGVAPSLRDNKITNIPFLK